jgi:DNA-binding NarL/FixJ family response regulator
VLKEAAAEELVSALLAAVRGERYVQPALAAKLVTPTPLRRDVLSDGERRVVDLLAQGHTNQQVADLLHCSLRTVEAHRARAKDKLGITSRADLISYGREQQPQ